MKTSSSSSYRFTVPPTTEQGSYSGNCRPSYGETFRQNALSDYNSARAHDGLPPLSRMPKGTKYARIRPAASPKASPVVTIHGPRFAPMPHFANMP